MPLVPAIECTAPEASKLTEEQRRAFVTITEMLERGQRVVKLCGHAGSGKTTLLIALARWSVGVGFRVHVAAPTHKAAGVISEKFRQADDAVDWQVGTIHSLLGLLLTPDMEEDTGDKVLRVNPFKVSEIAVSEGVKTLVVVDESSMLSRQLRAHVAANDQCQWLFVGDPAQLPPVGEGVSAMLQDPDVTLRRIVRQGAGSEIINLANRIRKGNMSMAFVEGKDVLQVSTAAELLEQAIGRFDTDAHRADPSHARLLVFRNATRKSYNEAVRNVLIGQPEPWCVGEWLVMHEQFVPERSQLNVFLERAKQFVRGESGHKSAWRAYFEQKEKLAEKHVVNSLHTSEEVRVLRVEESSLNVDEDCYQVWWLTVVNKNEDVHRLPVLKEESKVLQTGRLQQHMSEAQAFRQQMNEMEEREDGSRRSDAWGQLDKLRRNRWGDYFRLMETFANTDYVYAMTVHRSQGSTFDHAFIDMPDLMTAGGMVQQICYTAATRPAKTLTICK